mmetsp:Transcript_7748/g.10796  ORF Transcript_7748/g.10796 Transcript_7748/m.10796 type:complete len:585 (+) Transcript_7748:33-1787(+)
MGSDNDDEIWIVVCGFLASFLMAVAMGANDVANAFGTSVGSGVLTLRQAIILAGICNVLGAVSMSSAVTDTIRKGIVDLKDFEGDGDHTRKALMLVMLCAMLGSVSYVGIATKLALPVSTTQAILGALIGAVIAKDGNGSGVQWHDKPICDYNSMTGSLSCGGVVGIILQWFIAPFISLIMASIVFLISHRILLRCDVQTALRRAPPLMAFYIGVTAFALSWFIIVQQKHHPHRSGWEPHGTRTETATALEVCVCLLIGVGIAYFVLSIMALSGPKSLMYAPYLKRRHRDLYLDMMQRGELSSSTLFINDAHNNNNNIGAPPIPDAHDIIHEESQTNKIDQDDGMELVDISSNEKSVPPSPLKFSNFVLGRSSSTHNPIIQQDANSPTNNQQEVIITTEEDNYQRGSQHYDPRVESVFSLAQIATASLAAFAAGANDVANEVAPIAAILQTYKDKAVKENARTPLWLYLFAGVGIATGLSLFGNNVVNTIGKKTTLVTPARGFNIEFGYSLASLLASAEGWPVSTTQLAVGALVGVGLVSGDRNTIGSTLNFALLRRIFLAWILTPFTSAIFAAFYFLILKSAI